MSANRSTGKGEGVLKTEFCIAVRINGLEPHMRASLIMLNKQKKEQVAERFINDTT